MATARRFLPTVPQLIGRSPQENWEELTAFLRKVGESAADGIPAGFQANTPVIVQAGTAADPGTENAGWMASDATFEIETSVPSVTLSLGSAAAEGGGSALMRASATLDLQTVLAQTRVLVSLRC